MQRNQESLIGVDHMLVHELVAHLQDMPQEFEVFINEEHSTWVFDEETECSNEVTYVELGTNIEVSVCTHPNDAEKNCIKII